MLARETVRKHSLCYFVFKIKLNRMWENAQPFQNLTRRGNATMRAGLRIVAAVSVCALLFWGGAVYALQAALQAIDYPQATIASSQTASRMLPNLFLRRDVTYRTTDPFNKVYNWYSSGFELGPESYSQGRCILMAKNSRVLLRVEQTISVTVCDTPTDRMMFVMRSFTLRYPSWIKTLLP
jgi:hypothetical protein